MWSLSRLVALVLALALTLTSHELARARGEGVVSGTMVLCLGGTMMVVPMGPDGQPAGPAHVCPDGVLAVAAPPPEAALLPRVETLRPFAPALAVAAPPRPALWIAPHARAPPVPV
ncbi:MAG: hypothetical protein H3C51_01210 [Rubellimicrobium sp.]|nr:hypothetical protein [Rubellimicrobium sp.]